MDIDVFKEATELYNKYKLCEEVMEYLSDKEATKGLKYKETLATFVETFEGEFMAFVHERMTATGEAFEECGKCNCDNCPAEEGPMPEEPKKPVFAIGSKVEIHNGTFIGSVGTVVDFDTKDGTYYIKSDFNNNGSAFSMWFPESCLKAYVEESENPEQPTPIIPDGVDFYVGDKVKVIGGVWSDLIGKIGEVTGFNEERGKILVLFDSDGTPYEFDYEELEKINPENSEENGGTVTLGEG